MGVRCVGRGRRFCGGVYDEIKAGFSNSGNGSNGERFESLIAILCRFYASTHTHTHIDRNSQTRAAHKPDIGHHTYTRCVSRLRDGSFVEWWRGVCAGFACILHFAFYLLARKLHIRQWVDHLCIDLSSRASDLLLRKCV